MSKVKLRTGWVFIGVVILVMSLFCGSNAFAAPALEIIDLYIDPDAFLGEGETIYVYIRYKNVGTEDINSLYRELLVDNNRQEDWGTLDFSRNPLIPGDDRLDRLRWLKATSGPHTLKVVLGSFEYPIDTIEMDVVVRTKEEYPTKLYLEPATGEVSAGEIFQVKIGIRDVQALEVYQFSLKYDPTLFAAQSVEQGIFLASTGYSTFATGDMEEKKQIDNVTGSVNWISEYIFELAIPDATVSGSGILAIVNFKALQPGTGDIYIPDPAFTGAGEVKLATITQNLNGVYYPRTLPKPSIENSSSITVTPSTTSFTLTLYQGWNMISIPLVPPNNYISTVLAPIDGMYESVWAYDTLFQSWEIYLAAGPDFLNDIDTIDPGRGYWIKMLGDANLDVTGDEIANPGIQLYRGWNLVGYNSLIARDVQDAMSSINGIYKSIWIYNTANGTWLIYVVGGPDFLNDLKQLEPGKAYWIEVGADCVWDVSR